MRKVDEILKRSQPIIEKGLVQELKEQGHFLTGRLARSLNGKAFNNELNGEALDYIIKLNDGVPAAEIKIDTDALKEMTQYVELRMGLKGSAAVKVAYRILQKQQKEGMPTKGSYRFSKSGERKKVLERGFQRIQPELDDFIMSNLDTVMNQEFQKQKSETL